MEADRKFCARPNEISAGSGPAPACVAMAVFTAALIRASGEGFRDFQKSAECVELCGVVSSGSVWALAH